MTYPHPASEEQRRRLYPDSLPPQRPLIDMRRPCWWCPVEAERLATRAMQDAKWRWLARGFDIGYARSSWSGSRWYGRPKVTAAELAEMRAVQVASWQAYQYERARLQAYYDAFGSVTDNGAVRHEWAPGERKVSQHERPGTATAPPHGE